MMMLLPSVLAVSSETAQPRDTTVAASARSATASISDNMDFLYTVKCRGCHQTSGEGTATDYDFIPPLKDFIGNFLSIPGGRSYLVRVPGVYQANLTDQQTADMLNYIIGRYAGMSLTDSAFEAFTAAEIAALKMAGPIRDVVGQRRMLLGDMAAAGLSNSDTAAGMYQ